MTLTRGGCGIELPTELLLEAIRDSVVFQRQPVNVRIVMLIRSGGHANEERIRVANILVSVEYKCRNHHHRALVLASMNLVDHLIGRRFWPIVIKHYLDRTLADKDAIVMQMMLVPSFDFPGANSELINVKDGRLVQRPSRTEDLTQCAALVMECSSRPDLDSVDQFQNRLAVACRRLNVLLWLGSHTLAV